ncbi:MAG TPA: PHB depolymerase family esterase [Roseiflexaceae bacterium]|nr:PHB depolymerase family esterase [Roseiflexaceae bacterium]
MRSMRLLLVLLTVALVSASLLSGTARAATLVEITNFGTNPSGLRMHLYVPDRVAPRPAVLVAVHYCTGTGPGFYSGTEFASLADRYGFIVIYPSATRSGSCYDVSSPQTLRHDGGSDSLGIVSMVRYVLQNYGADASRVYVTGASSGAMMTNVLLGAYPDVFKAGAAFMGVPFACFATTDGSSWNSACANGTLIKTAQEWGNLARAAYPGYSGPRPRMQIWHGTEDSTLRYPNFGEQIKQWTNVHGLSQTPSFTDSPQSNWTRTRYGGTGTIVPVEAISIQGVGHSLPISGMALRAIQFFGLDTATPATPTPTRIATATPVGPTATPTRVPTVTPTPVGPTPTPGTGGTCSPVTSTITSPFTYDGAGTFCWRTNRLGSYINSWNLTSLRVNGVDYTNRWSNSFPAAIDGYWYISYSGQYGWSHFEIR